MSIKSNPELRAKGAEITDALWGDQQGAEMHKQYAAIAPEIETLAVEWVTGGIFGRPGLDLVKRELVAIASCVHEREPGGIGAHSQGALRAGATREEIFETILQCFPYCGLGPVIHGLAAMKEALGEDVSA